MNGDDPTDSDRWTIPPDSVAGVVTTVVEKQSADELWITRVDENVARIERGETDWQRRVTHTLATIADRVNAISMTRVVWPSLVMLSVMFLGGAAAVLLVEVLRGFGR